MIAISFRDHPFIHSKGMEANLLRTMMLQTKWNNMSMLLTKKRDIEELFTILLDFYVCIYDRT